MKQTLLVLGVMLTALPASADYWSARVSARLEGLNEVPVVSTPAWGRFRAKVLPDSIEYELTYGGLQAPVTQAHVHFAQPNVNGGIIAWLCGVPNLTPNTAGPDGTQVCPQSGTITGVITADNVIAQAAQGVAAREFEELVFALLNGVAYANVHTAQSPGGEIRGQIEVAGRKSNDRDRGRGGRYDPRGGHDDHGDHKGPADNGKDGKDGEDGDSGDR